MKERGIIMSDDEVRAILDGRKTQLRRAMGSKRSRRDGRPLSYGEKGDRLWVRESFTPDPPIDGSSPWDDNSLSDFEWSGCGEPLDAIPPAFKTPRYCIYRASWRGQYDMKWRPSSQMPRWASRITLEVTGVRVERVQDITKQDAIAEGARYFHDLPSRHPFGQDARWSMGNPKTTYKCLGTARHAFANSWVRRYGKSQFDTRPWDENPWVWVIEFKTVEVKA